MKNHIFDINYFLNCTKRFFSFEEVCGDYVPEPSVCQPKSSTKKREPEKKAEKKKEKEKEKKKEGGDKEKGEKKKEDKSKKVSSLSEMFSVIS